MFKPGDKVVCIDNGGYNNSYANIELYGFYTISKVISINKLNNTVIIEEVDDIYASNRFVSLTKFRKRKLNKIMKKIRS